MASLIMAVLDCVELFNFCSKKFWLDCNSLFDRWMSLSSSRKDVLFLLARYYNNILAVNLLFEHSESRNDIQVFAVLSIDENGSRKTPQEY